MTAKFKFAEGERVLCFHGPLIYEAKALKSTISKDKQIKYYIHYAGWSKNWDEWVPENRVLKYNEANVQRQKEVYKQHSNSTKSKKGKHSKKSESSADTRALTPSKDISNNSMSTPSSSVSGTPVASTTSSRANRSAKQSARPVTPVSKGDISDGGNKKDDSGKEDEKEKDETQKKKRGGSHTSDKSVTTNTSTTPTPTSTSTPSAATPTTSATRIDSCVESEETFLSKIEVKIKIPDELKQCLTDDWDAVTRQHKVLEVPAKLTVQDIVDQYMTFKKNSKSTNASKEVAINDVLDGIVEYFNVLVGSQLLYKFERPQYADIISKHPDTPLSQLYGSFHLLRLFVKLGTMLSYSALDEKAMQILLSHLHDFLKFLVKNSATYFSMSNFINVNPEYVRNAQ